MYRALSFFLILLLGVSECPDSFVQGYCPYLKREIAVPLERFGTKVLGLLVKHLYTLWDLVPALFFAHPNMNCRFKDAVFGHINRLQLQFYGSGIVRVIVIHSVAAGGAKLGDVAVSALSNPAPFLEFALKLNCLRSHYRSHAKWTGR